MLGSKPAKPRGRVPAAATQIPSSVTSHKASYAKYGLDDSDSIDIRHALSGLVQERLCLARSAPPSARPRLTHHLRGDRGPTTVGHHSSRLPGGA